MCVFFLRSLGQDMDLVAYFFMQVNGQNLALLCKLHFKTRHKFPLTIGKRPLQPHCGQHCFVIVKDTSHREASCSSQGD